MKKGFTLVELLAVIVVLAIISLIATPTLTKIVSSTRKSASIESARGYIGSINTQIISNDLDMEDSIIKDGTYSVDELNVETKGQKPSNAIVKIVKNQVKEARLCIGKYSIDYKNKEFTDSINNYCGNTSITFLSNGTKINPTKSGDSYTVDLKGITNINCSNGAIPEVNGNKLIVKNAIGSTTCNMASNLKYTFAHLNKGDNNITMVNDETVTERVIINKDYSVNFDLNGKKITMNNLDDPKSENIPTDYDFTHFIIQVYGKLIINDSIGTGEMQGYEGSGAVELKRGASLVINGGNYTKGRGVLNSGGTAIINSGLFNSYYNSFRSNYTDSVSIINGGHFKRYLDDTYATISVGSGDIEINGGIFESTNGASLNFTPTAKNKAVINGGLFKTTGSNGSGQSVNFKGAVDDDQLFINGGTFISYSSYALTHSGAGDVYINQTDKPIYMRSDAKAWKPVISTGAGVTYIKANKANKCTNKESDTKKGLCLYAEGDKNYVKNTANGAIQVNNTAKLYIDGGTYYGGHQGINCNVNGLINIKNAYVESGRSAILNNQDGLVNVCNSNIKGYLDLVLSGTNSKVGTINYDSNTVFTNGTNTPNVLNKIGIINSNYTGTCTE